MREFVTLHLICTEHPIVQGMAVVLVATLE